MARRKSKHRASPSTASASLSQGGNRSHARAPPIDIPREECRAGEVASLVGTGNTPPSSTSSSIPIPSSNPVTRAQAAPGATGSASGEKPSHRSFAIDISNEEPLSTPTSIPTPMSPRHDPQLGGYPPDCGSEELKYLSYAKVLHDRGQTHPMRYSTTEFDAFGNPKPQKYPLGTDFGAHAFHRLPTDSFVLSQYGVGMTLYFKYLKVMTWLFFLLVLLSAPALVIYIVGGKGSLTEFKMLARQNLPMILGMTSIGHLKESSSLCEQVLEGNTLSLTCPAGEIGFVKAVYSTQDSQGTCGCPEINNVAAGSGKCRGKPVISCSSSNTTSSSSSNACTQVCPQDGYGCFLGVHPVSKWSCCAKALDAKTKAANFDDMRIRSTAGCESGAIQTIVDGLCLGKSSCTMNVNEELTYEWKVDGMYETFCLHEEDDRTPGATCSVRINDESNYTQCSSDSKRSLIVYARCFTTRIDLSNEWSLKIVGWDSISRQDFLGLAIGCDIACSMCFFFIVIWMKRKEQENVARITKDQIKALDYTVQLVHLPNHKNVSKLREEIRAHLEKVLSEAPRYTKDLDRIRIADIQFGMNTSGHLELLRNRGVVVRRLDVALQRYEKLRVLYGRLSQKVFEKRRRHHEKRIKRLENKLMHHNARLDRWNASRKKRALTQAVTAFITFEEEEGFHRCLAEYPDLGFIYRLFQSRYKRLRGKRLRFRPAPDPTDIVWENLHYPYWSRLLRQLVVALITLAVLFMSFILIFLAKLQKTKLEREFGRPTSCPTGVTKDDVIQDELEKKTGLVPYKALVECYCKTVLATKSFHSMTKEPFLIPLSSSSDSGEASPPTEAFYCKTWATSYVTTQFLSFLSVLVVVFINMLLAKILNVLVGMEKHHTESSQVVSRVIKVFLAQFCNTAVLMVVINANLGYFLDHADFELSSLPILNGKYSDFTPAWYNDVGVALMLTMIINTFSPHVYAVVNYLALEAQRFYDRGFSFNFARTRQDTQRDLDALYRGPKFDLAARYAQTLTSIFIIYLCVWKRLVLRPVVLRWDAAAASRGLLRDAHDVLGRQIQYTDSLLLIVSELLSVPPHCSIAAVVRQQSGECGRVTATVRGAAPLGDRDLDVLERTHLPIALPDVSRLIQQPGDIASELMTDTSEIGEDIPTFDEVRGEIWTRITRPQVVVLFGFFVAFCLIVLVKIVLFEYFPSVLQSFCPMLTRLMQKSRAAKGIPNYFDAIPTPILREKATDPRVKSALREKFRQVLEKREALLGGGAGAGLGSSPRRRNRRSISAAEQYSDAQWIVGCASYAISDNKEYVDQLAIDSQLSEGISIEEIFCKDVDGDQAAPSGLSETYLVSQLSIY